jgi:hypothetical protein
LIWRWYLELLAGALSALATATTLVWPDWIEQFLDEAPDGGDGSAEWGLTLALCGLSLGLLVLAWRDGRRLACARTRCALGPGMPASDIKAPSR